MQRFALTTGIMLACAVSPRLAAQDSIPRFERHANVRVWEKSQGLYQEQAVVLKQRGNLLDLQLSFPDTLFHFSPYVTLKLSEIDSLEVAVRNPDPRAAARARRGTLIGMAVGTAAGLLIAALPSGFTREERKTMKIGNGLAGAFMGGGMGYWIGGWRGKDPLYRWVPVPAPRR